MEQAGAQAISRQFKSLTSKLGRQLLSISLFFRGLNGILGGIASQQPSMVVGSLLEMLSAPLLAIASTGKMKGLAMNLYVLSAGIWTLGFANEIANKAQTSIKGEGRFYDMTRFKEAFNPGQESLSNKAQTVATELAQMVRFTIEDHVFSLKKLLPSIRKFFAQRDETASSDRSISNLVKPSANISRLSVLLTYVGVLTVLGKGLFTRKPIEGLVSSLFKGSAILLANLSLFNLALQRRDAVGMAPLLGIPLSIIGLANIGSDLRLAMGGIGEGLNSLFFSDMTKQGLPYTRKPNHWNP
jgi:hypothetical protein